jgi:HEPN domain-containing protein
MDWKAAASLSGDPGLAVMTCFHCQQAAEKALKGYLAWLGDKNIPYTHDLPKLADLIVTHGGVRPPEAAITTLNLYAVVTRYGGPEEELPGPGQAEEAMRMIQEIMALVTQETGEGLGDDAS